MLYFSIAYFTVATEMRFVEIDKIKEGAIPEGYQKSSEYR